MGAGGLFPIAALAAFIENKARVAPLHIGVAIEALVEGIGIMTVGVQAILFVGTEPVSRCVGRFWGSGFCGGDNGGGGGCHGSSSGLDCRRQRGQFCR